jgi:hypothetical protein
VLAALYCVFAIFGSGIEVVLWCGVLIAAGLPVYYLLRAYRK